MDAFAQRVDGHAATGKALWLPYGTDCDLAMMAEFVSAIAESRVPQPDGAVGYRTLQIVLAGYESVRSGREVAIPPQGGNPQLHGQSLRRDIPAFHEATGE
jgi:predicted dehydrogenase